MVRASSVFQESMRGRGTASWRRKVRAWMRLGRSKCGRKPRECQGEEGEEDGVSWAGRDAGAPRGLPRGGASVLGGHWFMGGCLWPCGTLRARSSAYESILRAESQKRRRFLPMDAGFGSSRQTGSGQAARSRDICRDGEMEPQRLEIAWQDLGISRKIWRYGRRSRDIQRHLPISAEMSPSCQIQADNAARSRDIRQDGEIRRRIPRYPAISPRIRRDEPISPDTSR